MAARNCALPNIQDLSKVQERAHLLPLDGCHLVVGGPGTGKSVLALLRTRRHHRDKGGQDYVFLVFPSAADARRHSVARVAERGARRRSRSRGPPGG